MKYLLNLTSYMILFFSKIFGSAYLNLSGVDHSIVRLIGLPVVNKHRFSKIKLGSNITMISESYFTALGIKNRVILRTMSEESEITIGDNVGLSGTIICAFDKISIGSDCLIGSNVTICDTDFHPLMPLGRRTADIKEAHSIPIYIEDNVFIGANAIIMKGVRIGENTVIGAGSVVTKSIPSNVIAAGNPCRVIRSIF